MLPIPENINITKPMAMLKDSAGYVMHLLNEMQPFSHFWHNPKAIRKIKNIPVISEVHTDLSELGFKKKQFFSKGNK